MHRAPLPPGSVPDTHLYQGLSRPKGHGTVERKYVTEESSDPTGNRSRNSRNKSAGL